MDRLSPYETHTAAEIKAAASRYESDRIAELEAQLEAATKRRAKDTALLSGFVDALEEIAGSSSLTATPKQFAVHLQRIAKNSLLAAAKALGEK